MFVTYVHLSSLNKGPYNPQAFISLSLSLLVTGQKNVLFVQSPKNSVKLNFFVPLDCFFVVVLTVFRWLQFYTQFFQRDAHKFSWVYQNKLVSCCVKYVKENVYYVLKLYHDRTCKNASLMALCFTARAANGHPEQCGIISNFLWTPGEPKNSPPHVISVHTGTGEDSVNLVRYGNGMKAGGPVFRDRYT